MIYLDHAATSMHKPQEVYDAVITAMKNCASVGRSGHRAAYLASETAYVCRNRASEMFDCDPDQVVFTFNATHGLNIAINTLVNPGDRVVISGFEHNAVTRPLHHIGSEVIVAGTKLFDPVDTLTAFERSINSSTKAVICTHVSNVFGYILPVEGIAALCLKRRVPFVLDASQSAGVLPVSLKKLGAAFIAMPGHKSLLGPQGTGLLLCGMVPKPFICGGTGSRSMDLDMPRFLPDVAEAGTHNIPGVAGLSAALNHLLLAGVETVYQTEFRLMDLLHSQLRLMNGVRSFYGGADRQTGVLSFQIRGIDCEIAAKRLADADIAVRAGLHCSWLAHRSAGTLADGTIRVSFSTKNNEEEVQTLLREIKQIIP